MKFEYEVPFYYKFWPGTVAPDRSMGHIELFETDANKWLMLNWIVIRTNEWVMLNRIINVK